MLFRSQVDPSGTLYLAGGPNASQIFRATADGSWEVFAGQSTAGYTNGDRLTTATFCNVAGMVFHPDGNIYVAEFRNIRKIASDGTVSTYAGSPTGQRGFADGSGTNCYFNSPGCLQLDSSNHLIVADTGNHCYRRVTVPYAIVTTIAGGATPVTWLNST